MNEAELRALVPDLGSTIYLNTATMAAGCAPVREAYARALEQWSAGRFDWSEAERAGDASRASFARLIGAQADEVAIVPAVSAAAGLVAASLPDAERGANVVVGAEEFSSNYFPWLLLRERGYDVRAVPFDEHGPSLERFDAAVDGGTRLVAVSAVQSASGFRADLAAFGRIAARSGAWFFVDACQAAGAVPLDVVQDRVDFLASASHKFLLGTRGMGYLFARRGLIDRVRPMWTGWKAAHEPMKSFYGRSMQLSTTASRLDMSVSWFGALADEAAFGVFERFGSATLIDRDAKLSRRLRDALRATRPDMPILPEAQCSTIVSVPVRDSEATMTTMRGANVVASARSGRVRLSVHFYNTEEEIDRVARLLADA